MDHISTISISLHMYFFTCLYYPRSSATSLYFPIYDMTWNMSLPSSCPFVGDPSHGFPLSRRPATTTSPTSGRSLEPGGASNNPRHQHLGTDAVTGTVVRSGVLCHTDWWHGMSYIGVELSDGCSKHPEKADWLADGSEQDISSYTMLQVLWFNCNQSKRCSLLTFKPFSSGSWSFASTRIPPYTSSTHLFA